MDFRKSVSIANLVPYTGAKKDVDLGSHNLFANNLKDYVPYQGATHDVDLGDFEITAHNLSGENHGDQDISNLVSGPASAVDGHVVFFDQTTGKLIKDSGLTLAGSNTGDQDLSGLVPYTGATGDVDLGGHNIKGNNLSGTNTGDQDLSGLVSGPSSATNGGIAIYNGTTGKVIQDSGRVFEDTMADDNNIPDGHAIKAYGDANWASGGDFSNGGEAGGADRTLGNTDDYALGLLTNGIERLHITKDGIIEANGFFDVKTNSRTWYTIDGGSTGEVANSNRMTVNGSGLATDVFADWAMNVGPSSSGDTRNVVGMEINVQESEGDQGKKDHRTGKSSTILQIVPESTFNGLSGYDISFGLMFCQGSHDGNPRMHVGMGMEPLAISNDGDFMLLHGGTSGDDQPNSGMNLFDYWLCGLDTSNATLSYAVKTGNNQHFVSMNADASAICQLLGMAGDNQILVGYGCPNYVTIGDGSPSDNPVRIRVNGSNDMMILQSPDTDSGGHHYLVV